MWLADFLNVLVCVLFNFSYVWFFVNFEKRLSTAISTVMIGVSAITDPPLSTHASIHQKGKENWPKHMIWFANCDYAHDNKIVMFLLYSYIHLPLLVSTNDVLGVKSSILLLIHLNSQVDLVSCFVSDIWKGNMVMNLLTPSKVSLPLAHWYIRKVYINMNDTSIVNGCPMFTGCGDTLYDGTNSSIKVLDISWDWYYRGLGKAIAL